MSLWLSGANSVASRVRGQASGALSRQNTAFLKQAANAWIDAIRAATKPRR